jgi:FMN phosphatase YigB (HAD superfamily)
VKPTILIDMDDTLLSNPFDVFMPAYFKLLGAALSGWVEPKAMLAELLKSTDAMIQNNDFQMTLEEKFAQGFYSGLSLDRKAILPVLDRFYLTEFEKLKPITAPRPQALELVSYCFEKEYTVAVATNPLFPQTAMLSRLRWGDLPIEKYAFPIVTAYEAFHFAKPNPAYYAEILARLGWPEGPVLMIGNSLSDDIIPAASLGIKTFYLSDKPDNLDHQVQGSFSDILPWLKNAVRDEHFSLNFNDLPALLAYLRATPAAIQTLLSGCSENQRGDLPSARRRWRCKPASFLRHPK